MKNFQKQGLPVFCLVLALVLTGCGGAGSSSSAAAAVSSAAESRTSASESAAAGPAGQTPAASSAASSAPSALPTPTAGPTAPAVSSAAEPTAVSTETPAVPTVQAAEPFTVAMASSGDTVTVTLSRLPQNAEDLASLEKADYQTPQFAAALYVAAACCYRENPAAALEMIEVLNGPATLSDYDKSYLKDRLEGKDYKPYSYFAGSTPANGYVPEKPYVLAVKTISNTFDEDGYARFVMQSSGADSARPITVRKKASTGEWFYWDAGLFADIRKPVSQDAWG